MSDFSTCFPISRHVQNKDLSLLAFNWLQGVKSSKLLSKDNFQQLDDDEAYLSNEFDESLRIKQVKEENAESIGFQHEIPDGEGRIWRTECVITRRKDGVWAHVGGRCLIVSPEADHRRPRKPFIIKMMIRDGWTSLDGDHIISDEPHFISEGEVDLAARIISGRESTVMPQVYISRDDKGGIIVDDKKLAFDLGGLAHVFTEPSRRFSISLMNLCEHKNPYGGTIAVCLPGRGVIKKFYRRYDRDDQKSLTEALIDVISQYHASVDRPFALDWRLLQEAQSKELRRRIAQKLKDNSSATEGELEEYIIAFDEEIKEKNEKIASLERSLLDAIAKQSLSDESGFGILADGFCNKLGPELYDGEVSDRVRRAISHYNNDSRFMKSKRESFVLSGFLNNSAYSGRSIGLMSEIKNACRDPAEMAGRIGALLMRLNFTKSEEGKHLKYSPPAPLGGIDSAVLPKTSSDYRAGKNQASDIIENFDLRGLHKD